MKLIPIIITIGFLLLFSSCKKDDQNPVSADKSIFPYDTSAQWIRLNGPSLSYTFGLAVVGSNIYASGHEGLFRSTDNGNKWAEVNIGGPSNDVCAITYDGTNLFASIWNYGLFRSIDNGKTWIEADTGLIPKNISVLSFDSNVSGSTKIFAGTATNGIYLSTNNGSSWTAINSGMTNEFVVAIKVIPNGIGSSNIFAGCIGNGHIFLSTNTGSSWVTINSGLSNQTVCSFAVIGRFLFAGTSSGGVYRSTDNGASWSFSGLSNLYIHSLTVSGSVLFAGSTTNGVFASIDNGTTWSEMNTNLSNYLIGEFLVINNSLIGKNLFAGTSDGVWRHPL